MGVATETAPSIKSSSAACDCDGVFRPFGADPHALAPTAYAVGCNLSPLRGYLRSCFREVLMAEKKLRFKTKIQGKEAGVVAAITPPVDVPEYFGTRGRVAIRGT